MHDHFHCRLYRSYNSSRRLSPQRYWRALLSLPRGQGRCRLDLEPERKPPRGALRSSCYDGTSSLNNMLASATSSASRGASANAFGLVPTPVRSSRPWVQSGSLQGDCTASAPQSCPPTRLSAEARQRRHAADTGCADDDRIARHQPGMRDQLALRAVIRTQVEG